MINDGSMTDGSEKAFAVLLADRILDDPNRDPDGDMSVLARQLLRALERLGEYTPIVEDDS